MSKVLATSKVNVTAVICMQRNLLSSFKTVVTPPTLLPAPGVNA